MSAAPALVVLWSMFRRAPWHADDLYDKLYCYAHPNEYELDESDDSPL